MMLDDGNPVKWKSPAGSWKCRTNAQRMVKMRDKDELRYHIKVGGLLKKLSHVEKKYRELRWLNTFESHIKPWIRALLYISNLCVMVQRTRHLCDFIPSISSKMKYLYIVK